MEESHPKIYSWDFEEIKHLLLLDLEAQGKDAFSNVEPIVTVRGNGKIIKQGRIYIEFHDHRSDKK